MMMMIMMMMMDDTKGMGVMEKQIKTTRAC